MTAETRRIMRRWLWADYMLYDHFKAKMVGALDGYDISTMASRSVPKIYLPLGRFVAKFTLFSTNFEYENIIRLYLLS